MKSDEIEATISSFLGGARFHIQSNEYVIDKLTKQFYDENHVLYDEKNETKCLVQRSQTSFIPNNYKELSNSSKLSFSQPKNLDNKIKDAKPFMTRKCDRFCVLPINWGVRVFDALLTIKPCLNFKQMQLRLLNLDQCNNCENNNECGIDETCTDFIKIIFNISKHFQGLRTLLR